MAKQGTPWSIKGISTEATQIARAQAQAANVTVGAWLTAAIRQVAAEEAGPAATSAHLPRHHDPAEDGAAYEEGAYEEGAHDERAYGDQAYADRGFGVPYDDRDDGPYAVSPEELARVDEMHARIEAADAEIREAMHELEATARRLERRLAPGR